MNSLLKILFIFVILCTNSQLFANQPQVKNPRAAKSCPYPDEWWQAVDPVGAPDWEILPQAAVCEDGEVILSKRTELGIFSNFAATPFVLDDVRYASLEGFWQMMKYPEDLNNKSDPRNNPKVKWLFTRDQVSKMTGKEAKDAGSLANANLKKLGISWITYNGKKIDYRAKDQEAHYKIILLATRAKLLNNPQIKPLLLKTGYLTLLPDHKTESNPPPAYRYYEIWMELRNELREQ